ncbi:MAG: hypothetical protein H6813_06005 [Phycisphaeraceae bacterium]|nr:hypothetical protein [Phycisphaeraceae bacterium]MCB9848023.1 hypothetical protein [Phycisphaeraceae bacterium]
MTRPSVGIPTIPTADAPPVNTAEPLIRPLRILDEADTPPGLIPLMDSDKPTTSEQPQPAATGASANGAPAPAAPASAPSAMRPCPYCGHLGDNDGSNEQCSSCKGWFEPLSRQASQNAMGPWYFHDESVPFRPGCSAETLRRLIAKGRVTGDTLIRGPGSNQFWVFARHCPGVANLLGVCHNCARPASENDFLCDHCGAAFPTYEDRQHLGLAPVRLLPGQANPSRVAASAISADPDESNYGPVAPTFATAAVEAATARAESRPATAETIDEAPGEARSQQFPLRRDRRYQRLRSAVITLTITTILLLIAVGWLVLHTESREIATPGKDSLVVPPVTEQKLPDEWADRLAQADRLIETNDPARMAQALTILREAQARAPESDKPADLDTRIERLAEDLDAANLRNYLNKNN